MTFKIDPAAIPSITDRNPDGEALLGALQAIVPDLRERAGDAEAAGRIPQETIDELIKARAFQAVVPKRYGGLELPYPYIPQIFRVLGRGCSSTSWSIGFLIYHNFQYGHSPLQAQDEVWGTRGFTMTPALLHKSGDGRASPFPRRTFPTGSVTGMPRAV